MRSPTSTARRPRKATRGFTLLELMVVVLIITILAVISIPGIVRRMDKYRAKQAADQIAAVYRDARLRAMGRGAAVLVRFAGGDFQVREARRGPSAGGAGCDTMPATQCNDILTRFDAGDPLNALVDAYTTSTSSLNVTMTDWAGTDQPTMDICFTPLGRTFWRPNTTNPMQRMTAVPRVTVTSSSNAVLPRDVVIVPGGVARVLAR